MLFRSTATRDDEGRALLRHLGFPFKAVDDVRVAKKGRVTYKTKSAAKAAAKRKK